VADRTWQGTGTEFTLALGSVTLCLNVRRPNPGIESAGGDSDVRLLALDRLTQTARCDGLAFDPRALAGCELVRGRVEATYAPANWDGLRVRAAWSPATGVEGVDLEIQVGAGSAAKLRRLEVGVVSMWFPGGKRPTGIDHRVEARDARAAALSYDGRESPVDLSRLTTLPITGDWLNTLDPLTFDATSIKAGLNYVEVVRPNDVARRIIGRPAGDESNRPRHVCVRYGLLGHDAEKGVILRASVRGVWIGSEILAEDARELYRQFLAQPPSLGP
jgi:hypothetical protein